MKLVKIVIVSLLLFVPNTMAKASDIVSNNFENSTVNQFVLINCDNDCQSFISSILQSDNQINDETGYSDEIIDDNQSDDQVEDPVLSVVEVGDLRINEIMSNPLTGDKEWIEIYNNTAKNINLEGLYLEEGSGQKTNLSGEISASSYFVVDKSSLNNSGEVVYLKNQANIILDEVAYGDWSGSFAPAPSKGNSLIFWQNDYVETETVTKLLENVFYQTPVQTESIQADLEINNVEPVEDETAETAYQLSDDIRINELLPNPAGTDDLEWIELYNFGDADLDLFGWSLSDEKSSFVFGSRVIKAEEYLVLPKAETNISLNNSNETVYLKNPEENIISQFNYVNSEEAKSWSYFSDDWQITDLTTAGYANIINSVDEVNEDEIVDDEVEETVANNSEKVYQKMDLMQAHQAEVGSLVEVEAVVSVLPNTFSKNIIYLAGSGMQVYFSSADWPELALGDLVNLKGKISESNNEKRILLQNVADLVVISHDNSVEAHIVSADQIGEAVEGWLVQVEGELSQKDRSNWQLKQSEIEFKVYLKQGANIDASLYEVGDDLKITGIVSQVDDKYLVLPRGEFDLENISLENEPILGGFVDNDVELNFDKSATKTSYVLISFLGLLMLVNLYFLWQKKAEVLQFLNKKLNINQTNKEDFGLCPKSSE